MSVRVLGDEPRDALQLGLPRLKRAPVATAAPTNGVTAHLDFGRSRRRLVIGLREVSKQLAIKPLQCVILAPNIEKIESAGMPG